MALLDTHTWAWILTDYPKLSAAAQQAMDQAPMLVLSPVTFYEIAQKVRMGKWSLMAPHVDLLPDLARKSAIAVAPVSSEIAVIAGSLDWPHRDPFDRILAATALVNGWVLISADTVFDSLIGLRRIW